MDRGAWQATVHGISDSVMTEKLMLSLFHFQNEKAFVLGLKGSIWQFLNIALFFFFNYAFANVLLFLTFIFLQQRTKSDYELGECREELIHISPSCPG